MPRPLFSSKMFGVGFAGAAKPATGFICFISAAVFSWTTMSTVAGNSTLPLTWSPWVCVLTISVTGFGVSSLILSITG